MDERINERIKHLRNDILNLSRAAFGQRIGVSGDVINNLERGRVEIKEPIIKLICSEFQVDYIWLTTGEGDDPFVKSDVSFYEKIDRIMAGENDTLKTLIKKLVDAPEEDIAALKRCIDFCANLKEES